MKARLFTTLTLLALLILASLDAEAGRRSLRIDFGAWTDAAELGTTACPGSAEGSDTVTWRGIAFSGGSTLGTYNVDDYCQDARQFESPDQFPDEYLSDESLNLPGDEGLAQKVGSNDDPDPAQRVTARRYTFLARDRFPTDPPPDGYQWELFVFPGDQTLVRLNGELPVPGTDFSPSIDDGDSLIWDGSTAGYNGEYWCFDGTQYAGTWDGEPAGTSPLAGCVEEVCSEFNTDRIGQGSFPIAEPSSSEGCFPGQYKPGENIRLIAVPDPGFKVSGWSGTTDDLSNALVNSVTFQGTGDFVEVSYAPALVCPAGTEKVTVLSDDLESGAPEWTSSAEVGSNLWVLSDAGWDPPIPGTKTWRSSSAGISDQRLVTPAFEIPPAAGLAAAGFLHQYELLPVTGDVCGEGGLLEYTSNDGVTWQAFQSSDFIDDPYNGSIGDPDNPLDGQAAWCGIKPWTLAQVDLSSLAGESVRLRFRLGTTTPSSFPPLWDIDEFEVSACLPTRTIGGSVTGLEGTGLILRNNGADDLPVALDGPFTFPTPLTQGSGYDVTVAAQPASPSQTCTVTNGNGTVAGADVTDVAVSCDTNRYTVGGSVSGLVAGNITLQLNGGALENVTQDGTYAFDTPLEDGSLYEVTIVTPPSGPGLVCRLENATGSINGADVTDANVICGPPCGYTLSQPNGDSSWVAGETRAISWNRQGIDCGASVDLELYDAGVLLQTLATVASDGTFDWSIPADQPMSFDYTVRLVDSADPGRVAESAPFVINDPFCDAQIVPGSVNQGAAAYEACDVLIVPPGFSASSGSSVRLSGGRDIVFEPGVAVETGGEVETRVCGQSLCEVSANPMPEDCHSCVIEICDASPECCLDGWSEQCVSEVATCGLTCK